MSKTRSPDSWVCDRALLTKPAPLLIYPETGKFQGISDCAWPRGQFRPPVSCCQMPSYSAGEKLQPGQAGKQPCRV